MTGGLFSVQGEKAVRRALSAGEDQAAKTRGGQKQNEHDHGNNVAHHHAVELCAAEVLAVFLDLGDDPLRPHNPADQNARQQADEGHEETVADVVHHVEQLRGRTVGQRQLEVERVVTKADENCRDERVDADDGAHLLARLVEDLHAVGNERLHDGYTARQRGETKREEEHRANDAPHAAHRGKDLRQADERQARAAGHALGAEENIDRRNDHQTCEEGNARVEDLDLVVGLVEVNVVLDVTAVGDHDAHAHAEGEEELAHRVKHDVQETRDGQPREVGLNVDKEAIHARARHAALVRVAEREREDRNADDEKKQSRHDVARKLFNALFHAAVHDPRRQREEEQHKDDGRDRRGDEGGEKAVLRRRAAAREEVEGKILRDPAADDGVIRHDKRGDKEGEIAQKAPLLVERCKGVQRVLLRAAADGDVGREQGEAEGQHQHKVNEQKKTAAVLGAEVGEAPDVADAYRAAGCGQHKAERAAETTAFLHVRFSSFI